MVLGVFSLFWFGAVFFLPDKSVSGGKVKIVSDFR